MCDCIKEIEKKVLEETGKYEGKKILKASLQNVVFPMDGKLKIKGRITTQPLELELEGRKNTVKTSISHRFCPWCGEDHQKNSVEKQEI